VQKSVQYGRTGSNGSTSVRTTDRAAAATELASLDADKLRQSRVSCHLDFLFLFFSVIMFSAKLSFL